MSGWRNWPPSSPAPSRAPTHRKRTRTLRSTETVRWTFSPSDAVVEDRFATELEMTHEEIRKEIRRESRTHAPGGEDRRPGRTGRSEDDDGAGVAGDVAGHLWGARSECQPRQPRASPGLPHPG